MTTTAPSAAEFQSIAVNQVIAQAVRLSKDRTLDKWRDIYEPAKAALAEFDLTPDEYFQAISRLTEEMKI